MTDLPASPPTRTYVLVVLAGFIALSVLAIAFYVAVRVREYTQRTMDEAERDMAFSPEEVERFVADARRVNGLGVFSNSGDRDAGALLNKWVQLDGETEFGPDESPAWRPDDPLHSATCATPNESWPACVDTVPESDLRWMAELPNYDAWDPSASGSYARWLAANPDEPVWTAPFPDLAPWPYAARARLLQAREGGDLPAALVEVRALARLCWSSEDLVAQLLAIRMLDYERYAVVDAIARGVDVGGFTPISAADTAALDRYAKGLVEVYVGHLGPEMPERLEREFPSLTGRCGAILQAMWLVGDMRQFFEDTWPGEIDRSGRYAFLDAAAQDGRCRLPHVGRAWRGETRALEILSGAEGALPEFVPGEAVLFRIPWVRQPLAATIEVITMPTFNRYRKADPG